MTTAETMLASEFSTLPDLIAAHARDRAGRVAVADEAGSLDYAMLDDRMNRVAAALQRGGVSTGQAIAIVAAPSTDYAAVFLGALRAGCVAAPIAPSNDEYTVSVNGSAADSRIASTSAASEA